MGKQNEQMERNKYQYRGEHIAYAKAYLDKLYDQTEQETWSVQWEAIILTDYYIESDEYQGGLQSEDFEWFIQKVLEIGKPFEDVSEPQQAMYDLQDILLSKDINDTLQEMYALQYNLLMEGKLAKQHKRKRIKKTKHKEKRAYQLGKQLREVPNRKRKEIKKNQIHKREAIKIHRSYSERLHAYHSYAQPNRYSNKKWKQAKNRSERKRQKQEIRNQFKRYAK